MASLMVSLLTNSTKKDALNNLKLYESPEPLAPKIKKVSLGSYQDKQALEIRGSGYVVDSLEAALWAFWNSSSFEEGALLAVNLGDDADTTGAVYGQIAGAHYGMKGIPKRWLKKLAWRSRIQLLADKIYSLSKSHE